MKLQPVANRYALFVDGSPGPKTGAGWAGWGIALMAGTSPIYEACGVLSERVTTNAIELEALIHGLAYLYSIGLPSVVEVWTDSRYVMQEVAQILTTAQNEFQNANDKPVANSDRLKFIYELLYPMGMHTRCILRWSKGHMKKDDSPTGAGYEMRKAGNDLADHLSKQAAYKGEIYYKENRINEITE